MNPKPDGAAINSAATSAKKPVDKAVRIPAIKYGTELGMAIVQKIRSALAPSVLAASTYICATSCMPARAFTTHGLNTANVIIIILDGSSIPTQTITSGIYANAGIGRMASIKGLSMYPQIRNHPATQPIKIASEDPIKKLVITLAKLAFVLFSNSPFAISLANV